MQPNFELPEDESEAGQVLEGKKDLAYTMTYEIPPSFTVGEVSGIKIDRPGRRDHRRGSRCRGGEARA